jgi:hypothetical protein
MGISKFLVEVRGEIEKASKKLVEAIYTIIDYTKPKDLNGTYIEPEKVMLKPIPDPKRELAEELRKNYQGEIIHIDDKKIVYLCDLSGAQGIKNNTEKIKRHYNASLESKVTEIPGIEWEEYWKQYSRVGT